MTPGEKLMGWASLKRSWGSSLKKLIPLSVLLLSACTGKQTQSSLHPQGSAADQIVVLWWVMFVLGVFIFFLVVGLLAVALFRGRPDAQIDKSHPDPNTILESKKTENWIIVGGIVMPVVVLVGLFALTVETLRVISDATPSDETVIEVVGHQWWWEVHYPNQQVTTANEIHVPVGQPIALKLTSNDVIHSVWVPELHGKLDLNPGQTTTLVLQADQPGEYRGQCAEFCGLQHAKMALVVVAETPDEFQTWLINQAQPAVTPTVSQAQTGQEVFLESSCAQCHTIKGTQASGKFGPDLTHLASRLTLAAGTLPYSSENLAEWIADPQKLKPGNKMPHITLTANNLEALLAYLETLE